MHAIKPEPQLVLSLLSSKIFDSYMLSAEHGGFLTLWQASKAGECDFCAPGEANMMKNKIISEQVERTSTRSSTPLPLNNSLGGEVRRVLCRFRWNRLFIFKQQCFLTRTNFVLSDCQRCYLQAVCSKVTPLAVWQDRLYCL